ncbi:hypothetical protein EVAR_52400_1 [Eumeta japonica]|uniref:Uncharacterized protein n=1 Tax=Eumeta variegata TaxID=151549 RepID=A0A4C1YZZ9_EUMVA|nr:hypothetical protein EVAR_52400_1 [Eumeta japonica]
MAVVRFNIELWWVTNTQGITADLVPSSAGGLAAIYNPLSAAPFADDAEEAYWEGICVNLSFIERYNDGFAPVIRINHYFRTANDIKQCTLSHDAADQTGAFDVWKRRGGATALSGRGEASIQQRLSIEFKAKAISLSASRFAVDVCRFHFLCGYVTAV